jgi:hypothetical protein
MMGVSVAGMRSAAILLLILSASGCGARTGLDSLSGSGTGAGPGAGTGSVPDAAVQGSVFCSLFLGRIASCAITRATGPVLECGPSLPLCQRSPMPDGTPAWACCSAYEPSGGRVCAGVSAGPFDPDAGCPCVECPEGPK